jgi:protein TonB
MKSVVRGIPDNLPKPSAYTIAAPPSPRAGPLPIGGNITAPVRIKFTPPVYPPLAKAARMSGVVLLEAIIGKDGSVTNLRVTRPGGVFDQAALDAVRQWKYTPTMLNGEAVDVIMSVNVVFTLN